ncbi:hypothetical protein K3495_g13525 [Podosphaera aphanis]|nr:hypothetical protein K3495_g13525 [Podosphaera aphanis]
MQMRFRAYPAAFPTEESRIIFAGTYLTGIAYSWFEPHVDSTTAKISYLTYEEFTEALGAAFDDPDSYTTAERGFEAARQAGSWAAFMPKLSQFSPDWVGKRARSESTIFGKGFKDSVKDGLVGKSLPKIFLEFASECITLDNEIFARIREKRVSFPVRDPNLSRCRISQHRRHNLTHLQILLRPSLTRLMTP